MPTTVTTKHITDPSLIRYNPCTASWTTESSVVNVHQRLVITANGIQRRPKPEKLDYTSWTASEKQSTLFAQSGLIRGNKGLGFACKFNPFTPTHEYGYELVFFDQNLVLSPLLNWPDINGPMRAALKTQPINMGMVVAEFPETISMFRDMALGIRDAYRSIRRRKGFHNFHVSDIGSAHLMAQWGVRPLVEDSFNAVVGLNDRLDIYPVQRAFKLRVKDEIYADNKTVGAYLVSGYAQKKRTVRMVITYKTWFNPWITAGNPLEALWELVPMSTIINYMIPIGDYLSSLDAMRGVQEVQVMVTDREIEQVDGIKPTALKTNPVIRPAQIKYESHRRHFTDIGQMPFPTYSPSDSITHLKNSLALLLSMQRKKR